MPMMKGAEGVRAEKEVPARVCGILAVKTIEGVDGVVRLVVGWVRRVSETDFEARMAGDGEARHGEALLVGRGGAARLEGLAANGREEDADFVVRRCLKGALSCFGNGEMTAVRRVEAASKENDDHGGMVAEW